MEDIEYEIEPSNETAEEENETSFPWKPIMAAFVAGATSTAAVVAVRRAKAKKAALAEAVEIMTPVVVVSETTSTNPS